MKKLLLLTLALLLLIPFTACEQYDNGRYLVPVFYATVIEIQENYIVVEPHLDSDERKSASRIEVSTADAEISAPIKVGDNVEIAYDGNVAETHPAKINTVYHIDVVLIEDINSD